MARASRIFDSDLLDHPILKEIAAEYALTYRGNFDFMIQAKVLARAGELTPAIMRAVLNCLKYDVEAIEQWRRVQDIVLPKRPDLYVVEDEPDDEYEEYDEPAVPVSTARRSTPSKHKGEKHSRWVYTNALIKAPFGVASGAAHMRVLHRPDPYAEVEWQFPLNPRAAVRKWASFYATWPRDFQIGKQRIATDLRLRWLCGGKPSVSGSFQLLNGDPEDLIPTMAARPCRRCQAVFMGEEV